jgi:hypothetical protein
VLHHGVSQRLGAIVIAHPDVIRAVRRDAVRGSEM